RTTMVTRNQVGFSVAPSSSITSSKAYSPSGMCRELMDHAERWMREEIRHIPDGEYDFEDVMEDDGATENPTWFGVTMVVRGDEIIADWSRSDPQARGIVNATFGVTASATYNAIFHVTDKNIPHNSGCYRPIKIIAPPGSCVNVRYP